MEKNLYSHKPVIGFLIPEFPQQTHVAWWRVAQELRNSGYDVISLSTSRPHASLRVHQILEIESHSTFYAWPPKLRHSFEEILKNKISFFRCVRYISRLHESSLFEKLKISILIISAYNLANFCRRKKIEKIFVHSCANSAHLAALNYEISGINYALRLGGDPEVYGKDHMSKMKNADFIISASPTYFRELVDKAKVHHSKLIWSWVGVDRSIFKPNADWPIRSNNALNIITVARLNQKKGHLDIIEALKYINDCGIKFNYTIVGSGPFKNSIESLIDKYNISEYVKFLGSKDTIEVRDLLRRSDVHVLASYGTGEAAPAVVCEAMACGTPVICTRIGATPLMVDDDLNGFLVDQNAPEQIAQKLMKLSNDSQKLELMKRQAFASSEKFDLRSVAEMIVKRFNLQ